MSRQAHRHLIEYIPRGAMNGVFDSALLETIVPTLLRGRWTPAIPGYMATVLARNLLVENQTKLDK